MNPDSDPTRTPMTAPDGWLWRRISEQYAFAPGHNDDEPDTLAAALTHWRDRGDSYETIARRLSRRYQTVSTKTLTRWVATIEETRS